MRRILPVFAMVLSVLGLLPGTASADDPPASGLPVPLRVASYNIHAGAGMDGRFDLARQVTAIQALDADVVALQEVDVFWGARSQWRDLAAELGEALDMAVFFGPIYSLDPLTAGAPRREYGLAILSRYPIVHAVNHEITRLSTQVPNPTPAPEPGFPEVVVNARGALVHVYATHLDYRADPAVRRMQVADMNRIMAAARGSQRVLLGDFNAEPTAPELAPLWEHLTDAWAAANGPVGGRTYPAASPTKRIDYVTVSPGVRVDGCTAPATLASDHLPVVADLTVTRGW
ncbi:MAG TPA: endonuclease/exonuclease/phosphatase family protein [Micromonosporaceae bacterium]